MSIKKALGRVGIVFKIIVAIIFVGCGGSDGANNKASGGGDKSAFVGRWNLVKGPTSGNPEAMELLSDGTGIVDEAGYTYKTESGRFYLVPQSGLYKARSYSYTISGQKLTLTNNDGEVLKYLEEGNTLNNREYFEFLTGIKKSDIKSGSFTDSRNSQKYRTVIIGDKKWMGENLNFKTGSSWCYEDNESNCVKYGRLYDWETAKAACPSGWRLPSREEWNSLVKTAGGNLASMGLQSVSGWEESLIGNGLDVFGFSALPGGMRYILGGGGFISVGREGEWWSATESGGNAYTRVISYTGDVEEKAIPVRNGRSVRCIEDSSDIYLAQAKQAGALGGSVESGSSDFSLTGGRIRASIQRVVIQNMAAIRYAYNRRLRDKPGLNGKITVKFAIDEFGKVIFAQLVESTMADSELERTVVDRVKSWNFDKIDRPGDVTEVTYPFVFSQ